MNGVHDLGGMHGFGPVVREENEPIFHADWEGRVLAMMLVSLGMDYFNLDEFRHGVERMPPAEYLNTSYYQHWFASIERLYIEKGYVTPEELAARRANLTTPATPTTPQTPARIDHATMLQKAKKRESPRRNIEGLTPRFKVGDAVITRNLNPVGHTRLPRYARSKRGTIHMMHGSFVFADTRASGQGDKPQTVYAVCFTARELWGTAASEYDKLYLDVWEDYLDPA